MKKTIYTFITFIAAILTITTACVHDEMDEFPEPVSDGFSIDISFGNLSTRALATEEGDYDGAFNENKINSLDIFFYQGTTLKWRVNGPTYDTATKKATIPIIATKRALFENNSTVSYDIYVVANNSADLSSIIEEGNNLQNLKDIVFQTSSFVISGGSLPQSSFVMDGLISKVVNLNNPDLGTVNLKRAASKLRLKLVEVNVPGYTQDGPVSARLVHFTDKSALMDGGAPYLPVAADWKSTSYAALSVNSNNIFTTVTPFYAYANDWSIDDSRESFFELYVPLKDINNETKTYKYRVPVSPRGLIGDDAQYMNKLQRNFLYEVSVTVKILGSIEELPIEVPGNYIIKDWGTQEILVEIKGSHYLVVSERNVTMPNTAGYTLTFNSSIPNVTLVSGSLKATYTYVSALTGQLVTTNVVSSQMPTVTVQSNVASGNITINSPIPVNYIPKDIEFQITNGQLTETVIIRQLPATYYSTEKGERSNLRNQLEPAHNNPYMYKITTLAPSGNIIWGFPPVDANGNTQNNAEVANMVSPKFMMASQLGATSTMSYNSGVTNCQDYWEETIKNGTTVRYDDWRLPTEAEIKFLDDLQHDINNPQGIVMRGNYYWDAYSNNNAYQMKAPETTSGTATSAHVRCIRDIKD